MSRFASLVLASGMREAMEVRSSPGMMNIFQGEAVSLMLILMHEHAQEVT